MTAKRTEEQNEHQQPARPKTSLSSPIKKKRQPRGALFHSHDPTLAKRAEEELHTFGR